MRRKVISIYKGNHKDAKEFVDNVVMCMIDDYGLSRASARKLVDDFNLYSIAMENSLVMHDDPTVWAESIYENEYGLIEM